MTKTTILAACAVAAAAVIAWRAAAAGGQETPAQEEIGGLVWERRLATAVESAKATSKPLLVVFRCPP